MLQRLVREVIGTDGTVRRGLRLAGEAAEGLHMVMTEVAGVGGGVLLLPNVGLPVTRAADALRGQSQ